MKRLRLEASANFEANLEAAETHFTSASLLRVLERMDDFGNLLRHQPHIGRPYLQNAESEEHLLIRNIQQRLGGGPLRECVLGEFLVLYLVSDGAVHLLAFRNHRQREYVFNP